MTDRDALLKAILADPDDDIARLVYADCLEENGDPDRAAFIRLQVEASQADPLSPHGRRLAAKADLLLRRHQQAWTRHLGGPLSMPVFARGFVESGCVNAARFPTVAA